MTWSTAGLFRCEVTSAGDYETVFRDRTVSVVAIPREGPVLRAKEDHGRQPLALGGTAEVNCTSNSSDPLPEVQWYINDEEVKKCIIFVQFFF